MQRLVSLIKDVFVPVVTVVTATMVAFLNISVSKVEREQKRQAEVQRRQLEFQREARADRESIEELNFRLYDVVRQSLEADDAKQQEVAKALLTYMA